MSREARRSWSEVGAVTTAGTAAATIFCCLPLASGILGAGMAAIGARFAPFSSSLALVSVAFLGYAFYQAYRPGASTCADGSCEPASTIRKRRIALWLATVAVALLLSASWWANWVIYLTL